MSESRSESTQPPSLIPIDAPCMACGAPLAWRIGVGRYVISHATGDDRCSRATAGLADEDHEAARAAYVAADAEWRQRLSTPPAGGEGS